MWPIIPWWETSRDLHEGSLKIFFNKDLGEDLSKDAQQVALKILKDLRVSCQDVQGSLKILIKILQGSLKILVNILKDLWRSFPLRYFKDL